jgi:cytochrome P450
MGATPEKKEKPMQAPSQSDRRALISRHLGMTTAQRYSPAAEDLTDRLNELLADVSDLEPAEQARLLSETMVALSAKLAALHSGK